jgi:hypothetical protein
MENPRRRWWNNIGMDLKKAWCAQNVSVSEEGQWRAVSVTGTHIRILKEARNFLTN